MSATHGPQDRAARKQVLLTRIAFDRVQLAHDLAQAREAARLPHLLQHALGGGLARSLFGPASPAGHTGWVGLALALLRRYRVAAALVGAAAPLVRGRRGWRRLLRLGGLGGAAVLSWRWLQKARGDRDTPRAD